MPGKIKSLLCLRHFGISSLKGHKIRMQIMVTNHPPRWCALYPTSRYGRAMDRSQPSSQVSTTLWGWSLRLLFCVVKQTPPMTLFKEMIFTVHIFSMSTGAGILMDSPAAIWFSHLSLASFEFCCLHWFRCPISGLLAPGKQLVRVVAMALNLWSMGYPGRHDREWKCTSQNIILKRSEPQQRPSSAFFESFRSLNTKLKSVKHTIYVQLSYYKYCFFKCFFIIVSWSFPPPPCEDDSFESCGLLRRSQVPKCRRAPKRSRELRVVFAVGGCGRFGEVNFQPRSILFWLKKSEKFWMNFLMLQEVLC